MININNYSEYTKNRGYCSLKIILPYPTVRIKVQTLLRPCLEPQNLFCGCSETSDYRVTAEQQNHGLYQCNHWPSFA